ncbi:MAG: hypothetical protein LBP63_02900 [Prevotellaceae bacterium]|jgi:hypothetical protein|nr:hypothetical protein [Prevotellaceae bacterium]
MFLIGCKSRQEHSFYESSQNPITSTSDCDTLTCEEISLLRSGDIIMRQGRGAISLAISAHLNEKYKLSHCGILNIDSDSINVIHTLSLSVSNTNGMQQSTLNEFIDDTYKNSIIIVRLKNSDNNKIANKAKYYLAQKIPFDDYFDISDTTRFFCNELISHIIATEYNINFINAKADKIHNMQFGRFIDTAKFDIVINHQDINKQ